MIGKPPILLTYTRSWNMKTLLLSVLASTLFFIACKKEKDLENTTSFVLVNKAKVNTPYGYKFSDNNNGGIAFLNIDYNKISSYSGNMTMVELGLDTLIDGQTYTYKDTGDATYDKKVNFAISDIYKDLKVTNGMVDWESGTYLSGPTAGTIVLKRSGTEYDISYSLQYGMDAVDGQYTGPLTLIL